MYYLVQILESKIVCISQVLATSENNRNYIFFYQFAECGAQCKISVVYFKSCFDVAKVNNFQIVISLKKFVQLCTYMIRGLCATRVVYTPSFFLYPNNRYFGPFAIREMIIGMNVDHPSKQTLFIFAV